MSALAAFLNQKNTVRGATGILVVTLFLSNILGLFRDRLLAAKIPAAELDSYFAAFKLPDFLTNLIVVGAISIAFIPIFTELRHKSAKDAWAAASAILNLLVLILTIGSLFLILFMPLLLPLVVPEFDLEKLGQTIQLARWLSLTPVLFGVSYLLSGILNSFHRFAVYALAPIFYNLSIITATALLADQFGIQGVVIGVLGGAFLHMLIQIPLASRLGWRWQPLIGINHSAVKKVAQLMGPRMIGLAAFQGIILVATAIASAWPGAIAFYSLANNIQTMPTVVFANSIATALFPTISLAAAKRAEADFRHHLAQGIRWILVLLVPASAVLILLRIQIVRVILGAGHFGWEATQTTADVLGWFAFGLVGSGLIPLLARAFYARQDTRTPMTITLIGAFVAIGLSFVLPGVLPPYLKLGPSYLLHVGEVAALAIAFAIGMTLNALLLLGSLRDQGHLPLAEILPTLGRTILATLVMGLVIQATKVMVGRLADLSLGSGVLLQLGAALIAGLISYLAVMAAFRSPEWDEITKLLQKKRSTATSTEPA